MKPGQKVAALSQYLGHQTNNFAEYQGLIAALEYAIEHGHKALKVVSDSELLVRQIKGIYKVKNSTLQELHGRAKDLIAQLDWFSIDHALREHNREADELANEAMDKGTGRVARAPSPAAVRSGTAGIRRRGAGWCNQVDERPIARRHPRASTSEKIVCSDLPGAANTKSLALSSTAHARLGAALGITNCG